MTIDVKSRDYLFVCECLYFLFSTRLSHSTPLLLVSLSWLRGLLAYCGFVSIFSFSTLFEDFSFCVLAPLRSRVCSSLLCDGKRGEGEGVMSAQRNPYTHTHPPSVLRSSKMQKKTISSFTALSHCFFSFFYSLYVRVRWWTKLRTSFLFFLCYCCSRHFLSRSPSTDRTPRQQRKGREGVKQDAETR